MQPNRKGAKGPGSAPVTSAKKTPAKYVPSEEQAEIIKAYFLYNNFQDFNTWQQISKSKCEFEFNQLKNDTFQCKVVLKWDEPSMPIIVQTADSRNKRNSKKKALNKLIQNLIYSGLISFGFRDTDFIKKLPKRRREVSDSQSQEQQKKIDFESLGLVKNSRFEEALKLLNFQNFGFLASKALQKSDLHLWRSVLQALQQKENHYEKRRQYELDIYEEPWQDYCESQLKESLDEDLTDFLRYYQLQLPQHKTDQSDGNATVFNPRPLPSEYFLDSQSNNFIQFFHPIEAGLCFEQKIKKQQAKKGSKQMSFFADLQKKIPYPNFQQQENIMPIPLSVAQALFDIVLEFSYKYPVVHQALCILQEELLSVEIGVKQEKKKAEEYYLRHKGLLTAEFSYLLEKKTKIPALSLEGMLQWQGNCYIFTPKQPEEILQKKIAKKQNYNEMQQMSEFTSEEYVLLISKLNSSEIYIGQLVEAYPIMRLKCQSLSKQDSSEKHPFTMFKLANAKLYNRISKAIIHVSKTQDKVFKEKTFIIEQPPTYPIINVVSELLSEWTVLRETVLLVSQHVNEIHSALTQKGFKIVRINTKTEEKHVSKAQIICCTPSAACADTIKNYAFTRVIIEGAHRISETMCLLPMDKGSERIFLIGDLKLTQSLVFSPFAKKRNMGRSLMSRLHHETKTHTYISHKKQHSFDASILEILRKHFYGNIIDENLAFESPLVKGFPWPSPIHRIVYVHLSWEQGQQNYLNRQAQLCCKIVYNVLKSGFIKAKDIGCRAISPNSQAILQMKLSFLYKNHSQFDVKAEDSFRDVSILTGSRLKQRDLNIVLCENRVLDKSYLNASLQEGRRGIIIIGDFTVLREDRTWCRCLEEAKKQKLILSGDQGP